MAFGSRKTTELLITDADEVDLSRAAFSTDLTYTALDEETSTFSVTIDRIHFRKPLDIVSAVLEANGYASNFENLLSCFESMLHAVRIRSSEKAADELPHSPKTYISCLNFQLPSKARAGVLLKKFYAEIESYELEIARLRQGDSDESGPKKQSREELKRDLERLQTENSRLQATVNQLSQQLAHTMKSEAYVTRALESNKIIPPQLKAVLVREISLHERTITMKAGRTMHLVPLALLRSLPKIGDPCLLNMKDEQIIDAYLYDSPGRAFESGIAEVLHVSGETCKIRDSERKTHIWTAKNSVEAQLFPHIKRGSKVSVASIDGVIVKLDAIADQDSERWMRLVQENHTLFQVEREQQRDSSSLALFKGKA